MELKKITIKTGGKFAAAFELYLTAFPPAERRDESGHMLAMSQSDYRPNSSIWSTLPYGTTCAGRVTAEKRSNC